MMPEIDANHAVHPYAGCQKPGGGFPTGKFVGDFLLAGGHLLEGEAGCPQHAGSEHRRRNASGTSRFPFRRAVMSLFTFML